jgi:hypothetical protein
VICGKSRKSRRISVNPCVLEHVRQHETGISVIIKLEQLPETRTTTFLISHKQGRVHDKKRTGRYTNRTKNNEKSIRSTTFRYRYRHRQRDTNDSLPKGSPNHLKNRAKHKPHSKNFLRSAGNLSKNGGG